MSKFNVIVRRKGQGFHIGINVKHWRDVGAALRVAGMRAAAAVSWGCFYRQPPKKQVKAVTRQMTNEDVATMFGEEALSDEQA